MHDEEIRDAQEASWNRFSAGWRKWDQVTMEFLAPHGAAILDHLQPVGAATVLDIAAGTGEPGLSIARRLTGGEVVLTDLADSMLQVARDKAAAAGLRNVTFRHVDACQLPFADHSFDAVSCRLGFMFFPNMALAAREMVRVLKPGGRLATTVWSRAEDNFWVTCMTAGIGKHIAVPPPQPGAPGMFRCAAPGLIAGLFREAGLGSVTEAELPGRLRCGSAERYWEMMTEIAAPFASALGGASPDVVAKVKADVLAAMATRHPDGTIDAKGLAILGTK